mgnify:CR=1 FL=1
MNSNHKKEIYPIKSIFKGYTKGTALVTKESLSFWGGIDPSSGVIIDVHHELYGKSIKNRIFCFPRGAGSSSGCGVIMEMIRCNTNPAAIINIETESILALGPIIAEELYHRSFPMVNIKELLFNLIQTGDYIEIDADKGYLTRTKK